MNIEKQFKKLDKKALKIFSLKKKKYKIRTDLKSSKTLGRFIFKNNTYEFQFNEAIINKKGMKEIIIHEYAHYITRRLYGRVQAHGREWKSVMRNLGVENPRATTTLFSDIKLTDNSVGIKCKCRTQYVSKRKGMNLQKKLDRGINIYCRKCETTIKVVK